MPTWPPSWPRSGRPPDRRVAGHLIPEGTPILQANTVAFLDQKYFPDPSKYETLEVLRSEVTVWDTSDNFSIVVFRGPVFTCGRVRHARQGEPFLLLLLLLRVSFRLWRLRGECSESSENVRYAAGVISEKRSLKALPFGPFGQFWPFGQFGQRFHWPLNWYF